VAGCHDCEVVDGGWIPRWALEAESSLRGAGYTLDRMRSLFSLGRARVLVELGNLVRKGKRATVLESRKPHEPLPIDGPTKTALESALEDHRRECALCRTGAVCFDAQGLGEELELLFPVERRQHSRV
jgi:hypothetical protein